MQGAHSFGEERRIYELDGVRVAETCMSAGLHLDDHSHAPGQICFVLEGEYRERLAARQLVLRPGTLIVHAPREVHANDFAADRDVLALLISIDASRWLRVRSTTSTVDALLDNLATEMRVEMRRGDETARTALEGMSLLALSHVARLAMPIAEPEWLGDAIALIEHRYAEPLSLAVVAHSIAVHRTTVAGAFRRFRGTSVGESIRATRVARAKVLLAERVPLAEVAVRCGFHDQAHFTRVFRAVAGVTPGRFRLSSRA